MISQLEKVLSESSRIKEFQSVNLYDYPDVLKITANLIAIDTTDINRINREYKFWAAPFLSKVLSEINKVCNSRNECIIEVEFVSKDFYKIAQDFCIHYTGSVDVATQKSGYIPKIETVCDRINNIKMDGFICKNNNCVPLGKNPATSSFGTFILESTKLTYQNKIIAGARQVEIGKTNHSASYEFTVELLLDNLED